MNNINNYHYIIKKRVKSSILKKEEDKDSNFIKSN